MRKLILALLVLSLSVSGLFAQDSMKRPMTTDDAMNMINVGGAIMSPDGQRVLFSKSELNWDKNKRDTKYYMIPADGGDEYQFIGEAGGGSFRFSPDGKYITLTRTVDKFKQIFWMRSGGGEAVQLTKHKNSVGNYKWSADSKRIFFSASEPRSEEEEKEHKAGDDIVFVGSFIDGFGHTVCFRINGVAFKYSVNSNVSTKIIYLQQYSNKKALNIAKDRGRLIT